MAKRQSEVVVRSVPNVSLRWEMWADPVVKGSVGAIEGVRVLAQSSTGWVPLEFDPRYRPTDLITEIKALADGKPCQENTPQSLTAEARDLGNRAANRCVGAAIARECLRAVDDNYAKDAGPNYRLEWLPSVEREIRAIRKKHGLDPQPEPNSFSEQAAALGEKVGSCGGPTVGAALCYLKVVDQARSGAPEAWLWQIALHIFRRLRHGNWC